MDTDHDENEPLNIDDAILDEEEVLKDKFQIKNADGDPEPEEVVEEEDEEPETF